VRTSPCISLDTLQGHTLSSNKDILLTYARYRTQGITLLPTARTPTPNGMRCSWDFLLGRSHNMLVGPTLSAFLALEVGPTDKMSPQNLFWIFTHFPFLVLHFVLWDVCLMEMTLKSWRISRISCHKTHMKVKLEHLGRGIVFLFPIYVKT